MAAEFANFRTLSEKILTTYSRGIRNQEASFSLKHVAQLIAEEIAAMATRNAIENSNNGETFYTNDTFISTYTAQPVTFDSVLNTYYTPLPAIPAGLPGNREVAAVIPTGTRKFQFVALKNKDRFMNDFLTAIPGVVYYYIENGNLYYDNPTMFQLPPVTIKLIGAIPTGNLLDAPLNMPKSYEPMISENVIKRLLMTAGRGKDLLDDGVANPA